jgi:dihydropteroate synthase
MGIVNVTPDSFSGDGCMEANAAVAHALRQLEAGADLLDIGAESTRPGYTAIDEAEERKRLLPVVRGVRAAAPHALLSVDTSKAEVFRAAHAAGANLLNSVRGLNDALLEAVLACDAAVVLMHDKSVLGDAAAVVDAVVADLERQAARAVARGVAPHRVIVDPGIGFGKNLEQNLAVLKGLRRVTALGFPTLLGTSRKSFIGALTGNLVGDRLHGTSATTALAAAAGIDIVRVHDVAAARDVLLVADAIARGS